MCVTVDKKRNNENQKNFPFIEGISMEIKVSMFLLITTLTKYILVTLMSLKNTVRFTLVAGLVQT